MRGAFVRLAGAQRGSAYSNVQYLCTSSSSAISTCTSIYFRSGFTFIHRNHLRSLCTSRGPSVSLLMHADGVAYSKRV
jgi:hypothetical protein